MTGRRRSGLLLLAFSVLALLALSGAFTKQTSFSEYCVEEDVWQALLAARTATRAPLLTGLTFNEYDLAADDTDGSFLYSLIDGDDRAWDPPVRYRAAPGVRLAIRQTAITPQSIAAGEEAELLAYTDQEYRLYRLRCTTLPLVCLTGDGLETLIGADRTPVGMHFTLFDNRAGVPQRVVNAEGSIHVRGQTTAAYPKKGYRIALFQTSPGNSLRDYDVPLLGMRADEDWLLYAAYNDQERVRHVFCSKLWRNSCAQNNLFGVDNGNDYRYVELFLNGRYWGLYALGSPIDEKMLALATDETGHYVDYLFRKMDWAGSEMTELIEFPTLPGYELETVVAHEPTAWEALRSYYRELFSTTDRDRLYEMADIGNTIDVYLFLNLIQAIDSASPVQLKNIYITLYQEPNGRVALYTPWDMDLTWGNVYVPLADLRDDRAYSIDPTVNCVMGVSVPARLLALGDSRISGLIRERYAALRADAWSEESLFALLDDLACDIYDSGAYARDCARWPQSVKQPAALRLSRLKEYVAARLQVMDDFVAQLS